MHATPCLLCEQLPQGHPFPCDVDTPNAAEDCPVVVTLRDHPAPGTVNAAALPMAVIVEMAAAVIRTMVN